MPKCRRRLQRNSAPNLSVGGHKRPRATVRRLAPTTMNGRLSSWRGAALSLESRSRDLVPNRWKLAHSPTSDVASCWEVPDRFPQSSFEVEALPFVTHGQFYYVRPSDEQHLAARCAAMLRHVLQRFLQHPEQTKANVFRQIFRYVVRVKLDVDLLRGGKLPAKSFSRLNQTDVFRLGEWRRCESA